MFVVFPAFLSPISSRRGLFQKFCLMVTEEVLVPLEELAAGLDDAS
jgi:hypothetical protein